MNTFRTMLVVIDHAVIHPVIRGMFPPTVIMVRYGEREALRGHRFNLVLRTHPPRLYPNYEDRIFEHDVDTCSPRARIITAHEDVLAAMMKSFIRYMPWMIDGGDPVS